MRGFLAFVVLGCSSAAFGQFTGPTPYLSSADSPLTGPFAYSHLENFEDGLLNTPGVISSAGWVAAAPGALTDSVDGDDGAIDGSGIAGRSWYSGFVAGSVTFTFDGVALGGFPTHVGLVWTDVGQTSGTSGVGPVSFTALDAAGASLGSVGPFNLGDGIASGGTAEDRFFGIVNAGGVSSITMSMGNSLDWEVDHLQYAMIPEPTAALALASIPLLRRKR